MWGETGLGRLLSTEIGGQIGWLLPTALLLLVAGLWFTRRAAAAPSLVRAGLVLWGGWLVVTAATFSFMAGIFHAYYTVALAPAIGALVGTGAWLLWQHRSSLLASGVASAAVSLTTVLSFFLLGRTADFVPWLRWVVLLAGLRHRARRRRPRPAAAPARGGRRRGGARGLAGRARRRTPSRPRPRRTPARSRAPARRATGGFGGGPGGGPGGRPGGQMPTAGTDQRQTAQRTARRRRRAAQRQRVHRRDHRAAAGGRRAPTPGSRPRSAPTPRPATSWPARSR